MDVIHPIELFNRLLPFRFCFIIPEHNFSSEVVNTIAKQSFKAHMWIQTVGQVEPSAND